MIRISGSVRDVKFERARFNARARSILESLMREAAREALRVAHHNVTVRTGQAMGSLLPLADVVDVPINIVPVKNFPRKNASTGRRLGGPFKIKVSNNKATISYNIRVPYFDIVDKRTWRFLDLFRKTFRQYIQDNLAKAFAFGRFKVLLDEFIIQTAKRRI